jgi:hypothetical protein
LESDAVEVFLLLGAIWAAVLVPPWLESRREARSIASIMSFRSQLWSLQRATPDFGLDSYGADGDDEYEDVAESEDAEVHALNLPRRSDSVGEAIAPGVIGAVVRSPSDGFGSRSVSALSAAVHQRRAVAYRRRRHVLSFLLLASLAGAVPAVLLGPAWIVAEAVAATLLVAYLALLVRRGRLEAERAQKVRYLTPIRAPRPSVVIIGSGAAR